MKRDNTLLIIILTVSAIFICCLCTGLVLGIAGLLTTVRSTSFESDFQSEFTPLFPDPTPTPVVVRPQGQPEALPQVSRETLEVLENTLIPENDPRALAMRLEGKTDIPLTVPAPPRQLGDQETFWVSNNDTDEHFQILATLQYVTDHVYFWVEDGVGFREREVADLAETFDSQIYPTNREFFGSEWTPGIDEDPHIYILLAENLGNGIAGYFPTTDEFHPLVQEFSNSHEMFMLNADTVDLDDEFAFGVLAHEFQHMIHWNQDRNEDTWLDEGFSSLAMFLNGYTNGGFDFLFIQDPDLQLTDWPVDPDATGPHYGASFLFTTYFLDRFGEEATQALVAHPANGLVSVDAVLAELGIADPLTGAPITADDVFLDWVLASYLDNPRVADGRYTYSNYPSAPQPRDTESVSDCGLSWQTRAVQQYGADYIGISCRGEHTLRFEGSTQVSVVPEDPYSGDYAFWSNKGNESDMTLTQTFDFRDHAGPLTLTYWTWFDLEEDYDYVYLEATTDGESWEILITPSGTGADPNGSNYGWGYTGLSRGGPVWVQEEVDLSRFAGQQLTLQFEYITDANLFAEGFLIDDIAIPEIGYFADFEAGDGGWEAAGFVRIQNLLPQSYRLALITRGDETRVEYISLGADNTAEIPLDFGDGVDKAMLVVTGTTRFTRLPATYRFSIDTP